MKVLLCMFYLHLIDDYVLQGILAQLKQRDFWKPYGKKYQADYVVALLEHGFMNAFLVHIPIYIWLCRNEFALAFTILLSTISHSIVDDAKANDKTINLIQDQVAHLFWIMAVWVGYLLLGR